MKCFAHPEYFRSFGVRTPSPGSFLTDLSRKERLRGLALEIRDNASNGPSVVFRL
jgi:hypothetical protein